MSTTAPPVSSVPVALDRARLPRVDRTVLLALGRRRRARPRARPRGPRRRGRRGPPLPGERLQRRRLDGLGQLLVRRPLRGRQLQPAVLSAGRRLRRGHAWRCRNDGVVGPLRDDRHAPVGTARALVGAALRASRRRRCWPPASTRSRSARPSACWRCSRRSAAGRGCSSPRRSRRRSRARSRSRSWSSRSVACCWAGAGRSALRSAQRRDPAVRDPAHARGRGRDLPGVPGRRAVPVPGRRPDRDHRLRALRAAARARVAADAAARPGCSSRTSRSPGGPSSSRRRWAATRPACSTTSPRRCSRS